MPKPSAAHHRKPPFTQDEERISAAENGLLQGMQRLSPYLDELTHNYERPAVLPAELYDKLAMLATISHLGPAAQNAQRVHGVPASFLIASHITDYGFHQIPPSEEGERFAGERHFLNEARGLATSRKFSSALKLADSPVAYARRLWWLGFFDEDILFLDVVWRIVDYDLFECDWRYAAVKPPYEVTLDQAAEFLPGTRESIRALLDSGQIEGMLDKVYYRSLFSYEQRWLVRLIESEVRGGGRGRSALKPDRQVPAKMLQVEAEMRAELAARPYPAETHSTEGKVLEFRVPARSPLQNLRMPAEPN